jgi:2-isopropylmalate synthase
MQYKLRMTPEQVVEKVDEMVRYAKAYCPNIEFSCEDATRSDPEFLKIVIDKAIRAGATVINVPDTVGYTTPTEMRDLISYLIQNVPDSDKVEYSVHCHNDLGMAVANALAGVQGGALQIECTVNGIGERAGNTSLEEVVMAMRTRPNLYGELPRIDTKQIYRSSNLVYNVIGQTAPHNKPIVGANAFAHESGIHQHGILANKSTYEIMTPEAVGLTTNALVLGKHSGRHAFAARLAEMGYKLSDEQITDAFTKFKDLCDKKKNITDSDIEALVNNTSTTPIEEKYRFVSFTVSTKGKSGVEGTICLRHENQFLEETYCGDGSIDSLYAAIDQIINAPDHVLEKFAINAVSEGKETLGEVTLRLRCGEESYSGHGLSTDIMEAAIIAYLNAINHFMD